MTQPEDKPIPVMAKTWEPDHSGRISEAFYRSAWVDGYCRYCGKVAAYYPRLDGTLTGIEIPCDCEASNRAKEAFIRKRTAQAPVVDNPNAFTEPAGKDDEKLF